VKALVIPKYGAPEVFVERDLPIPEPKAGEILIRVEAAGVNFADLVGRVGLYPDAPKKPFVPGYEVCGLVERIGPDVHGLKPGMRVMAFTLFNGYAEYAVTPEEAAWRLPARLGPVEAAAIPVAYGTAYLSLIYVGAVKSGERILIHAAAGGVGVAAVQLAQRYDVEIFGTAGAAEKVAFLQNHGVHHAINYREVDFVTEIKRRTGGKGVHLILDALGGRTLRRDLQILAPLGRLVCYGTSTAVPGKRRNWIAVAKALVGIPRVHPFTLTNRNIGIHGVNLNHLWSERGALRTVMMELIQGFETGALQPIVAATFPLTAEGAAKAHHYLHDRKNIGKVVLISNLGKPPEGRKERKE